ncbi:unnamed protein product [Protopolystoma xenopodis]|uniref:Uncharacterized protein n=1 Tax=Protopolystoma xenopodis TaxID=117903 RepID=A0A3S5FG59_9PLAT|nr:unnamed protein product [Protopolystoma xenopodis]
MRPLLSRSADLRFFRWESSKAAVSTKASSLLLGQIQLLARQLGAQGRIVDTNSASSTSLGPDEEGPIFTVDFIERALRTQSVPISFRLVVSEVVAEELSKGLSSTSGKMAVTDGSSCLQPPVSLVTPLLVPVLSNARASNHMSTACSTSSRSSSSGFADEALDGSIDLSKSSSSSPLAFRIRPVSLIPRTLTGCQSNSVANESGSRQTSGGCQLQQLRAGELVKEVEHFLDVPPARLMPVFGKETQGELWLDDPGEWVSSFFQI